MKKEFNELRDELGQILGLDFSDIDTGYNKIEERICEQLDLDKLSEEQLTAIFSYKYSDLFQNGIPHVSWNTDRSGIYYKLVKELKPYSSSWYEETWYTVYVSYFVTSTGVAIKAIKEEPRVWGSGSTKHNMTVIPKDSLPSKKTHTGIILGVDPEYGKAFIRDQFSGSEDEVTDWVLQMGQKYGKNFSAKIIRFAE